jgi:hypothetical protein
MSNSIKNRDMDLIDHDSWNLKIKMMEKIFPYEFF